MSQPIRSSRRVVVCLLACLAAGTASAGGIAFPQPLLVTGVRLVGQGFTGVFNPEPTDIYQLLASNPNDLPIFSLDVSIEGSDFTQVAGQLVIQNSDGLISVAGVLPGADSFLAIPSDIELSDVLLAPGTSIDNSTTLAAAYTVVGDIPLFEPRGEGVLAVLAVPSGTTDLVTPRRFGTAVLRSGLVGPLSVPILFIPEPSSLLMLALAMGGGLAGRR